VDISDKATLLVAAQVQAGMLEHTYWADLVLKAHRVARAIDALDRGDATTKAELDGIIGDREWAKKGPR